MVASHHFNCLWNLSSNDQEKCFNKECGYDGREGVCLPANITDPWENCYTASRCRKVSEDGVCNPECNTRDCLFDSYDCILHEECPASTVWVKVICNDCISVVHTLLYIACTVPERRNTRLSVCACERACVRACVRVCMRVCVCVWNEWLSEDDVPPPRCMNTTDNGKCDNECNTPVCPFDSKDCGSQDFVSILSCNSWDMSYTSTSLSLPLFLPLFPLITLSFPFSHPPSLFLHLPPSVFLSFPSIPLLCSPISSKANY